MNYCVCCLQSLRILVALECLVRNFSENSMKEKGAKIFESELQYRLVELKCLQSPKERSSVVITKTQSETSFYHGPFDTETFVLCMTEWTSVRRTFADAVFLSESCLNRCCFALLPEFTKLNHWRVLCPFKQTKQIYNCRSQLYFI